MFTVIYSPNGVFKAVMRSPRIDAVAHAQLFDVPEPLKLGRVNNFDKQRMKLYKSVNRVVKNLRIETTPDNDNRYSGASETRVCQ